MTLIEFIKAEQENPFLILDAGNLLFKSPPKTGSTRPRSIATGIASAYQVIGYDAVGISPLDLLGGKNFWNQESLHRVPWVSANIESKELNIDFSPYQIKVLDDVAIGLIGLTGIPDKKIKDFIVQDWREALNRYLPKLSKECTFIVLLSSLTENENIEVTETYPEINLILTADKRRGNVSPKVLNNTLVTQTAGRGKYLGQLDIGWNTTKQWKTGNSFNGAIHKIYPGARSAEMDKIVQQIKKDIRK
jgi:2',3'-cyclic-nucleotide 2'-phosphodiesterase (5'-nucleotidase family)